MCRNYIVAVNLRPGVIFLIICIYATADYYVMMEKYLWISNYLRNLHFHFYLKYWRHVEDD